MYTRLIKPRAAGKSAITLVYSACIILLVFTVCNSQQSQALLAFWQFYLFVVILERSLITSMADQKEEDKRIITCAACKIPHSIHICGLPGPHCPGTQGLPATEASTSSENFAGVIRRGKRTHQRSSRSSPCCKRHYRR